MAVREIALAKKAKKVLFVVQKDTTIGWRFPKGISKRNGCFEQKVDRSLRRDSIQFTVTMRANVEDESQLLNTRLWDISVLENDTSVLVFAPSKKKKATHDQTLRVKADSEVAQVYFDPVQSGPIQPRAHFRSSRNEVRMST